MKRTVYFISDGTGLTAEALGHSLLAQFPGIEFEHHTLPYIDTVEKAHEAAEAINVSSRRDSYPAIVFDTIINKEVRAVISACDALITDIFSSFLSPLEKSLQAHSSYSVGCAQNATDNPAYINRIEAVHYALDADDGAKLNRYDQADIILIGVSRSGKTPTSLYLAMQFGVFAANYPITEEDLESNKVPKALEAYRHKLYALSISPERLSAIRNERRANSRYASIIQCEDELRQARSIYERFKIPVIDTTSQSIEEISTRILADTGIERRNK
ncbi:hypothetical protein EDC56_0083 [Sinobacterium caligoides]|uniref:Putative phosphoenolpyruvate synthase regulatory protein n=1 Tax=Sinobacterium caligoides TaxID=933926 RepID=A0A3N2DXR3_9GAMM|nr:pyruvate, water dikinase regulatory protein [Sinobacterium caligoides]ROS04577.1 hypothetical protein EDC56_0083 [Sinobacterium caligoides]